MATTLETLRDKPEHHRRRIAVGITSAVMLVIVGIWIATFPVNYPQLSNSNVKQAAAIINNTDQSQDPTSLDTLNNSGSANPVSALQLVGGTSQDSNSNVSNNVVISDPNSNQDSQSQNSLQVVQP